MRHLGTEKVEDLAKQRFYWAEMYKDIDTYIRRKCPFVKEKQPNWEDRAWLVPIKSTYPFEIVSLDFLKLDKAKKILNMFLLWRITSPDMFRHLPPKPNLQKELQRSCTTITFSHMRFHLKFVMTSGREFHNSLFAKLHQLCGIKSLKTTPYHPNGDAQTEWMNRTIISMLKTLNENKKTVP